jgi:hypothetical protein
MLTRVHGGGTTVWSRWGFAEDLTWTGASFRNKVDNAAARFLSLSEGYPLESTSSKPNAFFRTTPLSPAGSSSR